MHEVYDLETKSSLVGNPFIRIEDKHPSVLAMGDGGLFLRTETPPGFDKYLASEVGCYLDGSVRAMGINHDNLLRKGNAFQAVGQIIRLVFRDNSHGKGYLVIHKQQHYGQIAEEKLYGGIKGTVLFSLERAEKEIK